MATESDPNKSSVAFDSWLRQPSVLEAVATVEHERWSHWQRYLHSRCEALEDGSLVIPAALAARWATQMETPYAELSDEEKKSDREQAQQYLDCLAGQYHQV